MSFTVNEYVHENLTFEDRQGNCVVMYEPLDNAGVVSLMGTTYIEGRESNPFQSTIMNYYSICLVSDIEISPQIKNGVIDRSTGIITLIWDQNPGEHFLCVSYSFNDIAEKSPKKTNWIEEGF